MMNFVKQSVWEFHSDNEHISWENQLARIPLSFMGLWPNRQHYKLIKFIITISFIVIIVMIPAVVKFWFIVDQEKIFTYFISGTMQPYIVTSLLIALYNNDEFESIVKEMTDNWKNNNKSDEIMISWGKKSRFVSMAIFGSTTFSFILFVSEPLLHTIQSEYKKYETAGDFWYPFTITNSVTYALTYSVGVFGLAVGGFALCGLDSTLFLFVFHGCGQMALLRDKIQKFRIDRKHNSSVESDNAENSCCCLKCIVDDHVRVKRFVKKIDDCFNVILLLRLGLTTIHVTVETFEMLKAVEYHNFHKIPPNIAYLFMMSSSLLMYCWFGEQCIEHANSINDALCQTMWADDINKSTKSLVLMFRFAQRPITITAGNHFILSLKLYKEFVFTSVSYISVLLAIILGK